MGLPHYGLPLLRFWPDGSDCGFFSKVGAILRSIEETWDERFASNWHILRVQIIA
ncbi:hypothetical protein ATPR_0209 [Acetobacter tropicalis NBRC 101654]|uniref:Uncharacterized protein n=1 Tax=Acetobacter tropicalis NBRC 101654 TaxID=749388 RepID=F7VA10_9PROT|nr:hypothetical protein ATPR_0209 [Acetobacter tropicalis NBRC 101654]